MEEEKIKVCPRCNNTHKVYIYDFKDFAYLKGEIEDPPLITAPCHGVHPIDPYEKG